MDLLLMVFTPPWYGCPTFDEPADIQADGNGTIPARRIQPPPGARVAFDIPLRGGGSILMTDYASADCWDGSRIRTWIAQSGAFR